jgi:aspartyl-tRNA(Asn)/glutamyl-tRNA(Gln) amidotransferase subunit A
VISRFDNRDPTSLSDTARKAISLRSQEHLSSRPWRIGVPLDYNIAELDPAIRKEWVRTLEALQKLGHSIIPVELASTKHALSAYYIIAPAEASSNLAKYDGVRYGHRAAGSDAQGSTLYSATRQEAFGPEVRRRILLGTYSLSSEAVDNYFIQAQKIRRLVQMEFDSIFSAPNILNDSETDNRENGVDVLVCPTAPKLPPRLAELINEDPVDAYKVDVFTVPASLAGLPAMSVPLLRDGENGNIGMQIIGQYGMDEAVVEVASLLESQGLAEVKSIASRDLQSAIQQAKSSTTSRQSEHDARHVGTSSSDFPRDLLTQYTNLRRHYGNDMKAVRYTGGPKDDV